MSINRWHSERQRLQNRIDRLIDHAKKESDEELQAELTKYLCILLSGLIETQCKECASAFASKRAAPEILRFLDARLRFIRTSSCATIRDFFREFDADRAQSWYDDLPDEDRDAVDSIKNNRNQLAHGRFVGLSLGTLLSYQPGANRAMSALFMKFPPS